MLSQRWLRPSLGWRSSAALWDARRTMRADRRELRHDLVRRAPPRLRARRCAPRLAERLAIEQALEDRGQLRGIARGWC